MKMKSRFLPALTALILLGAPLPAHEFWLDANKYQVSKSETLEVQVKNGENFKGINLAYFDRRIVRFDRIQANDVQPVKSRAGDIPAFRTDDLSDGLMVLAYESTASSVKYNKWEKFAAFAKHKDFPDIGARHDARGLPREQFRESYTRYSKALIGVGAAEGADLRTGLEIEFVALANPYTDDLSDGMPFQLFYGDAPHADAQVELFERAPSDDVVVTYHRTDDDGLVSLPVKPGHSYLVDSVVLRVPSPELLREGQVWETLWAALTFAVPD